MDLFTAKKLTALRKYYSLSQEALAEKAGVSRQAVSKWERGEASPDTDNLLTLSRIYSVSIDDLLGEMSAEELIASIEKRKAEEDSPETAKTVDTQGPATEVVNAPAAPATGVYTENPPFQAPVTQTFTPYSAPQGAPVQPPAQPPAQPPVQPPVQPHVQPSHPDNNASRRGRKNKGEKPAPLYPGVAKNMLKFPYIIIAAIVYIIIGYTAKIWHPTWLIFLTIPAYYLTAPAFFASTKKKFLLSLPVYYYIVMLYVFLGILFGLWAKTWILFLFIPVYYWLISIMKSEKK